MFAAAIAGAENLIADGDGLRCHGGVEQDAAQSRHQHVCTLFPTHTQPVAGRLAEFRARSEIGRSEKLDQTAGVICPPDIDPATKAPTPNAGKTPVIPPPGSPGGDPSVRPK